MIYLGKDAVGLIANNPLQTDTGVLTIDSPRQTIVVDHHLDAIPDFAMIEIISPLDANKIPYGCCVFCIYGYMPQIEMQNVTNPMMYYYNYRHPTSGNFLGGTFSLYSNQLSKTEFYFNRGNQDWAAVDTDGNPIQYKWAVGKLN